MRMESMRVRVALIGIAAAALLPGVCFAQTPIPVPAPQQNALSTGSPYYTIAQNILRGPEFSMLSTALGAAGLDHALSAADEFTIFAPINAGFARLPDDVLARLMQPENRTLLSFILRNHVVTGKLTQADIARRISAGGGSARLQTLSGQFLRARMSGSQIVLDDANGNSARILAPAQTQANGMLIAVDGLLLPKPGS